MLSNKKVLVICQLVLLLLLVVSLMSLNTWKNADWLGKFAFLVMYIVLITVAYMYSIYRLNKKDLIGAWGFSILPPATLILALIYLQATTSL